MEGYLLTIAGVEIPKVILDLNLQLRVCEAGVGVRIPVKAEAGVRVPVKVETGEESL